MYSIAIGRSVSCIVVRWPKIETSLPDGPKGITAIAMNMRRRGDDRGGT